MRRTGGMASYHAQKARMRAIAVRILWAMSRLVMVNSWRTHQPVADAAHGLHEQRIGGIGFDLAAQAVDLDVDGALAHLLAIAGPVSYTHLRAHETDSYLVCRL